VYNKNLKMFMPVDEEEQEDTQGERMQLPKGLNERLNKHQLLVTSIYNKVIMLHLSPQTGEIYIHELDPNMTFKYS